MARLLEETVRFGLLQVQIAALFTVSDTLRPLAFCLTGKAG